MAASFFRPPPRERRPFSLVRHRLPRGRKPPGVPAASSSLFGLRAAERREKRASTRHREAGTLRPLLFCARRLVRGGLRPESCDVPQPASAERPRPPPLPHTGSQGEWAMLAEARCARPAPPPSPAREAVVSSVSGPQRSAPACVALPQPAPLALRFPGQHAGGGEGVAGASRRRFPCSGDVRGRGASSSVSSPPRADYSYLARSKRLHGAATETTTRHERKTPASSMLALREADLKRKSPTTLNLAFARRPPSEAQARVFVLYGDSTNERLV